MTDRPLRAMLAGVGGMGEAWLRVLSGPEAREMGVVLAGVCDADPRRAAGMPGVPLHERISDALSAGAEIVVDCTSPHARLATAGEALLSGAHVLVAGLLAPDEGTAAQLLGASARSAGFLAVSQPRRFQPGLRQMRDLVREGRLGAPQTLLADLHMAPRFGGPREAMRHVMLREMAIHAFDAARCVLGADALSVSCLERTPEGQPFAEGPEIHATFEMTDGSLFVFHGNWAEQGPPSSWNASWRLSLAGGAARWDGEGPVRAWVPAPLGVRGLLPEPQPFAPPSPPAERADLAGSLESLVRAIRSGRPPETQARDNAASLAMVLAAIQSSENGGRREPVRRLGDLVDATGLPRRVPVREG